MNRVAPLAFACVSAGCGVLLGTAEDWKVADGTGATGGAGGSGGAAIGGGGSSSVGGGSSGCETVYVDATTGADSSEGCGPGVPMRTIQAAIARVAADAKPGRAIAVCAGTYDGPVTLDFPVSLRGGYDCATWQRPDDYGYPDFSEAVRTTIVNEARAGATLEVSSPEIGASVSIDGFRIEGGAGDAPTEGVLVSSGGPLLTHCWITGGSGTTTDTWGSAGVGVGAAGWPEIAFDRIEGGSGAATGTGFGSVGVIMSEATAYPYIHDSQLEGGSGTTTLASYASVGAVMRLSSAHPFTQTWGRAFEGNVVFGGTGDGGACSIGLVATGAGELDIDHNVIHGGTASSCGTARYGVYAAAVGADLRITRNRIYGGDGAGSNQSAAVVVSSSSTAAVSNNMLHGGNGAAETIGLLFQQIKGAYAAHNSIFAGTPADDGLSGALYLDTGTVAAVVDANLLFAADVQTVSASSLILAQCADAGQVSRLRTNWITSPLRYIGLTGSCSLNALASASAIEQELMSKCTVSGTAVCVSFGGTVANSSVQGSCPDALPGCATTMFGAWSGDHGVSDLMAVGWKLQPTAPCNVTQSIYPYVIPVDLYGTPRTAPVSLGAHEHDGSCVP